MAQKLNSDELLALVRTRLRLDVATGDLYWLPRDRDEFQTARAYTIYHRQCAGRRADLGTYACNGYRRVRFRGGGNSGFAISAHRIVFALFHGCWPTFEIDHIDRCRTNNAPSNLRDVPHRENMQNLSLLPRNSRGQFTASPASYTRGFARPVDRSAGLFLPAITQAGEASAPHAHA